MYDRANNCTGVLNDFDLAHVRGNERPSGTERTGTMPFMALDLLTEDAWAGKVERLYRHDCESFAWVLLWICSRYDNGAEINNPPFNEFITSDYSQCYKEKLTCGTKITQTKPTASHEDFWPVLIQLIRRILERRYAIELGEARPELTDDEVVGFYQDVLKKAAFTFTINK
jgi:Fungal protein kinase